jgi:hypothetical protein
MVTSWDIYWLTRFDGILGAFTRLCLVGVIGIAVSISIFVDTDVKAALRWVKRSLMLLAIAAIGCVFTPSTKEMAAILVIPKIANSDTAKELAGLGIDIVGLAKVWVEELKPKDKP